MVSSSAIIEFNGNAIEATEALSKYLVTQHKLYQTATQHDVESEVIRVASDVSVGALGFRDAVQALNTTLHTRLGKSVVVFALGGISADPANPRQVNDRVMVGTLSDATEREIDRLTRRHALGSFRFPNDSWWEEDFYAKRADPDIFDEQNSPSLPCVIAVVVDSVGSTARFNAYQLVKSLLGAILIVAQYDDEGPIGAPWIMGDRTIAENPRNPSGSEDNMLPLEILAVESSSPAAVEWISFFGRWEDIEFESVMEHPKAGLVEFVANLEASAAARRPTANRVAAACRHCYSVAVERDIYLAILNATVALEALVSDHSPGGGATDRFVKRLSALLWPEDRTQEHADFLSGIYDERSRIVHQGFSSSHYAKVEMIAGEVRLLSQHAAIAMLDLMDRQSLWTDDELFTWLDAIAATQDG